MKKIVLVIILLIGIFAFWFRNETAGTSKKSVEERYVIPLNGKEEQILEDLGSKGFIKNKKIFSLVLNFVCWQKKVCPKTGEKIAPGAYRISKRQNAFEIAEVLMSGPYQKWVVVLPGKRKEQVAVILQKTLGWPENITKSFINFAQEGYLYPDTYLIGTDADPQQIIEKLKINFNEKFDLQLQKDLLAQNIRNDTALKIASLVERESGGVEDKPIIAGIIWNRLNQKMRLEIDATVQYAIVSQELLENDNKIDEDYHFWPVLPGGVVRTIDSPYNTYLINALPPGPICSPGIDSLRAVAYPAQTEALYYLHSPDKKIHTAKTYKEHQENIKKYLQ